MPRANRHYVPGLIWHITHRCHKREFLLKFARDRRRWLYWLYEAKKRYGLVVLGYTLTSNHIHLLVQDGSCRATIPASMDLIAGRTGQQYNQRKKRRGAFWEDRYHSTAIESGSHLVRCMIYIDLNMVRAGRVGHPGEWPFCGYNEILGSRQRYNIIHWPSLLLHLGMKDREEFRRSYKEWVEDRLNMRGLARESEWTEGVAVGSKDFVGRTASALGIRAQGRAIEKVVGEPGSGRTTTWVLAEDRMTYSCNMDHKNKFLGPKNRG